MKITKLQRKFILKNLIIHMGVILFTLLTGYEYLSPAYITYGYLIYGIMIMMTIIAKFNVHNLYTTAIQKAIADINYGEKRKVNNIITVIDWIFMSVIFFLFLYYVLYIPAIVHAIAGGFGFIMIEDVEKEYNKSSKSSNSKNP